MKIPKKVLYPCLVLLLLLVAAPWAWMTYTDEGRSQEQEVLGSFYSTHGADAQLVQFSNPEMFYVAIWRMDGRDGQPDVVNMSLFADGVWATVASQQIQQPPPEE